MNAVIKPRLMIRPMVESDLSYVMVVETAAYEHPWTLGIFRDCMRVGYYCAVGQSEGVFCAHAIMSEAVGEAHVLNLCVHPHWQGEGYGRQLLQAMIDEAIKRNVSHMFLEVRHSNHVAQQLYATMGFNEIAQRPGYYPTQQGRETALVFAKTL
jgi:[ribosomal protein S18]-alanine N-acetyltransferase